MEDDYIYWKHDTPFGIRIEEIGGNGSNEKVWQVIARQIYCEHGETDYRDICHFDNGAPYIASSTNRISISHSGFLFAVASLPRTPEADLGVFNVRTALGIDVERRDRDQVLRIRDKFLSPEEMTAIGSDDVERNVLAWTCKEALFKAALTPGLDWKENLKILSLPEIDGATGKAAIIFPDGKKEALELYSYDSDGYIVTLAYSLKCAKFKKR